MRTAFLAAILALVGVAAARAETIVLYGNAEQRPKAYLDEHGVPKGFAVDAGVEVLRRAGYDVTVRLLPFARAMQQTAEGGVMTGVFYSDDSARLYKYSDPFIPDDVVVVVAKGREFPFAKAEDLAGKRIGMQGSFFYGSEFAKMMATQQVIVDADSSPNLRMKKLSAGRVDAVLIDPGLAAFRDSVLQADLPAEDFTVLSPPLARLPNHLILGRNVRDGDAVLARLNKAIAECAKDGTFDKILARYDQE
jgi:polar amino acid transport system substrate-binding protein